MGDETGNWSSGTAAGWFPDPLGRYDHRWYNGTAWTADVSVDGQRYVDPLPLTPTGPSPVPGAAPSSGSPYAGTSPYGGSPYPGSSPYSAPPNTTGGPPGWQPYPAARRPTRTMAVLAFVFGLTAVATGWMPFVFVVGAGAGIAGLVLGIVARRRIRRGEALGGGLAVAALVLAPIGLALCVLGAILTGAVWRELTAYLEPGPNDVEITGCSVADVGVEVAGTIENLDDEAHDYTVSVEVFDGDRLIDRTDAAVDDVAPGEVATWDVLALTGDDEIAAVRCEVFAVNGPFPWGVDPEP